MIEKLENEQTSHAIGTEKQSIRSHNQEVKLPKINIPQFNGNYNDWGTFKDLYTSLIHNQSSLNPVQKLHYLKSSLGGEAEQLLKHIQITEKNYDIAWKTLHNRYNNKRIMVNSILNRFLGQKKLSVESAKGVKDLLDISTECLNSLKNNDIDIDNWDPIIIHLLVNKLDMESHKQWEEDLKTLSVEELPSLERFSKFLEGRFRVLEMVQTAHPKEKPQVKANTFHVIATPNSTTDSNQLCVFCNEEHFIYNCKEFAKLDPEQRSQEVQKRGLCFNCLRSGHSVRFCKRNTSCLRCKRKHHTLLHVTQPTPVSEEPEQENKEQATPTINIVSHCALQSRVTPLATALVNIMTNKGKQVVRALIDPCSQESFIREETVRKLQLKRTRVEGQVTGVGKMTTSIKDAAEIQIISRINENYQLNCTAYVMDEVTDIMPATKINNDQWSQLHGLKLADPTYYNPGQIDLLLGVHVYADILMNGVIKGKPGSPVAQQTLFGWIISGGESAEEHGKIGKIVSMHLRVSLDNMLQRFWESDTLDTERENTLKPTEKRAEEINEKTLARKLDIERKNTRTPTEKRAEEINEKTLARDNDGRFIVGLPFVRDTPIIPENSRTITVKRLECLEIKVAHNSKLKTEYDNVVRDFYMDNVLTGFDDEKSAIEAHEQLNRVMSNGEFELQKWASNSKEFISAIQPEKRENSNSLDMNRKSHIKTLGIIWNTDEDNLRLTQKDINIVNDMPVTKRNVLRQIVSLFDPLGWLASAIMTAKIIMQKLWLEKLGWDEELPTDLKEEWSRYQVDLPTLSQIQVDRWTGSQRNSEVELHGFSNACHTGCAAIRVKRENESQCQVSLITAKTKVAPVVKPLSLPRLELCGASLKLMKHVMTVLNIELQQTYAWVDSKVVLAWIKGDPNRWTSYVKNRVIDIRSNLHTHWLYVNTKDNPADPASRGLSPSKLKQHQLWFNGPKFLRDPELTVFDESIPETGTEKRLLVKCKATTVETDSENITLLKKYSSLQKLLDVVSYCRRWLTILKKENYVSKHITCEEKDEELTL